MPCFPLVFQLLLHTDPACERAALQLTFSLVSLWPSTHGVRWPAAAAQQYLAGFVSVPLISIIL